MSEAKPSAKAVQPKRCDGCGLGVERCICLKVERRKPKVRVLVLQHPQEPRVAVSTGQLSASVFSGAKPAVGLSWRNLEQALGEAVDVKRWGVLYLGSVHPYEVPGSSVLFEVDKAGNPKEDRIPKGLDGVVVLDGTWSQAKTLWWRNAWLLKLRRLVLRPSAPAAYHKLRKEPRRECLSTIETVGAVLDALENSEQYSSVAREGLALFMNALPKPDMRHRNRGRGRAGGGKPGRGKKRTA